MNTPAQLLPMSIAGQTAAGATPIWRTVAYLLALLLILHASFRGLYADLDSVIYTTWYQELSVIDPQEFFVRLFSSGWTFAARDDSLARFEWGFSVLGWLTGVTGAPVVVFYFVVACLSIVPKAYLATKYTRHPVTCMIWYASFCYLLLEMNAMRAGIAAALMLLALEPLFQRRYGRYVLLIVLAAAFHVSSLIALLLPLYLRWRPTRVSVLVALGVTLGLSFVDITVLLGLLGGVFEKLAEYKAAFDSGFGDVAYLRLNPLNLSSIGFLIMGLLWLAVLPRAALNQGRQGQAAILFLLPMLALFSLASFPIVAGRMSEMLCIYQLLAVAYLIDAMPEGMLGRTLLLSVAGLQFYIQNFRTFNVDFFYFVGVPSKAMISLIEQKIAIDAVLSSIFSNL